MVLILIKWQTPCLCHPALPWWKQPRVLLLQAVLKALRDYAQKSHTEKGAFRFPLCLFSYLYIHLSRQERWSQEMSYVAPMWKVLATWLHAVQKDNSWDTLICLMKNWFCLHFQNLRAVEADGCRKHSAIWVCSTHRGECKKLAYFGFEVDK